MGGVVGRMKEDGGEMGSGDETAAVMDGREGKEEKNEVQSDQEDGNENENEKLKK